MENYTNDITIKMNLTLEEMYSGVSKKIKYKCKRPCTSCDNSKDCSICFGKGLVLKEVEEEIKIPEGVGKGMVLKFKNKGHFYYKKKKIWEIFSNQKNDLGNLILNVEETKHDVFQREKSDLIYHCQIKQSKLELADERIEIQHLNKERIKILIPKNTSDGKIFRIKGKGFKNLANNQMGNLLIVTKVI